MENASHHQHAIWCLPASLNREIVELHSFDLLLLYMMHATESYVSAKTTLGLPDRPDASSMCILPHGTVRQGMRGKRRPVYCRPSERCPIESLHSATEKLVSGFQTARPKKWGISSARLKVEGTRRGPEVGAHPVLEMIHKTRPNHWSDGDFSGYVVTQVLRSINFQAPPAQNSSLQGPKFLEPDQLIGLTGTLKLPKQGGHSLLGHASYSVDVIGSGRERLCSNRSESRPSGIHPHSAGLCRA